jgi:hypothetical protein
MHKVSRIYVANAGYKLAWYDGLLLQFTDVETGEPTHSIYNLVNQGGKTTFLSLFFSTFDTAKDRFLQHLSNKGQRFEHYFDKDGLPGFIVVEWRLPGDLASPTKTLVTGQIVVMKKAGDTFEPDRIFFWFHASPALSLDAIPAPKLAGGAGREMRSREHVMRWLHDMRVTHPGHFDYTQNQSEWRLALESEGLDMEMLRHQVDFNRKEGSMDEAFLDFKSEYDFTRRFLSLAMETRGADDVRELVATHCRRMTRRKPLETSRLQLEKLRDTFAGFASAARDYLAAENQRQTAETDVAVAISTLDVRSRERLQLWDELSRFAEAQENVEKLFREQKISQLKEAEACRSEVLRRAVAAARTAFQAAETNVASAEIQIRLYQAAELLAEQELRQGEVNQLNQAIEAAHEDIRPFRESLGHKAALFQQALWDGQQEKTRHAGAAKIAAEVAVAQLKVVGEEEKRLHAAKTVAERDGAQLEQRIDDAEKRRAALTRDGILLEDEHPEAAMERLSTASAVVDMQQKELETRSKAHEDQVEAIQSSQVRQSAEKAKLSVQVEQLDKEISEADDWRDRLNHDAVLTRSIGAEVADPDSEVLSPSLTRFIQRTQDDLTDAELELARLEEDERSIRDTGLAGHDPDVSRVVRHLTDAGVANASSHAEYLAQVLPQADAARTVVMSDPARFLGVAVPNELQLGAAQEALMKAPTINKPVVVSIAADRATPISVDRFVVLPVDDSLYCFSAAQARAGKLAEKVEQARRVRDQLRTLLTAAHQAETILKQYQAKFGHGRLDQLRQELRQVRATLQEFEDQFRVAKQKLDTERDAAKATRDEEKRCFAKLAGLRGQIQQLQTFLTEYASKLTEWQARLAAAKLAVEQRKSDLDRVDEHKQSLESERLLQLENLRLFTHEARVLADELGNLQHVDTTIDAKEELVAQPRSLEILRSEYQTAATILARIEQEKTGQLVIQRDEILKAVRIAQEKYRNAAEGLEFEDVRAHMGVDYRDSIQKAKAWKVEMEKRHLATVSSFATAQQSMEEFQRKRVYASFSIPGIEDHSEGDLAFRLRDSEHHAVQAEEVETNAKNQGREARDKAKEQKQSSETYANQAATLKGLLSDDAELPPADLTQFDSTVGIGEICEGLARTLKASSTRLERAHKTAHSAHERVQRIAGEESFIKVDAELSVTLKNNPLDATIQDHARIEAAITDRMAAVLSELSTMDQDFERASEQLLGLVNTAMRLLHRAAEDMRLPDSVPVVGGLTVVKMSRTLFTLTQEGRRAGLKPYMEELAADGNIPETGAALATQALLRLANNRLGIRILKMVDAADEQYVPVDGLSHSGAERISMALLLYFIIAKLRYEQRAHARKAQGGVLFLDNPFAKATARPIWQAILSLADAMGVQLIITTGMKEYETLSVFRRFLRLARTERNATTGRTHVSVADFNFRPDSVKEVA